ncbi:tRNA(fMet)-specific endonuclease VapC [Ereboglobus sp. PH5-5]|uniref:type II toxin-antitoxin system VapC family toxin n=1 Tax=Ereboglobus sp. PH5-5 TaxID=2940529 RepID=UPI002406A40C|nr:type II toxin-antitoxin system VapC family toxin [Ereboglobus sp. PH5-5]MDF9833429.1 tRNA(fMet)-specific endonuclease VapC [Ereboglobus sp. PH5-5]
MPLYLPDTNVLSRFLRGRDLALKAKALAHIQDCKLSAIPLMELQYGVNRRPDIPAFAKRLETLREVFDDVAPFDEEAAFHAARVRAYLEALKPNAQPIGPYDLMLAGHALALGATVVTHNVGEFGRVPGLAIEDWQGED